MRKISLFVSFLVTLSMLLAACAPAAQAQESLKKGRLIYWVAGHGGMNYFRLSAMK